MVDIYETIYNLYESDLPSDVAEKLIEFEKKLRAESQINSYTDYDAYLTEYCSAWAEEYESKNQ